MQKYRLIFLSKNSLRLKAIFGQYPMPNIFWKTRNATVSLLDPRWSLLNPPPQFLLLLQF